MATYLTGLTDVGTQIAPTEPNLQFDAQILGTLQSKFDANHAKASKLYSSILNSDLTRSNNIAAKEEFFKLIQGDLQKMAHMDFSKEDNVANVNNVFKSFYSNKGVLKDVLWTKNYNEQVSRGESFKNCTDPAKCGGQYWQEGMDYMAYKKAEFKNADDNTAMGMEDVSYVPFNSTIDKAIDLMTKAKLKVKKDYVSGKYMVTQQNGELLEGPLSELFQSGIMDNPNFKQQYEVKSYVDRNNYAHTLVARGEAKDLQEGYMKYFQGQRDAVSAQLRDAHDQLNDEAGLYQIEHDKLMEMYNKQQLPQDSKGYQRLMELRGYMQKVSDAQSYFDYASKAEQYVGSHSAMNSLNEAWDKKMAATYLLQDINKAAHTLSNQDAETTHKLDEAWKIEREYQLDISKMNHQASLDMTKLKYEIDNGKYDDANGNNKEQQSFKLEEERKTARQNIELLSTDRDGQILKKLKKQPEWSNSSTITDEMKASSMYAIAKGELDEDIRAAKSKANKASLKLNGIPDYPEALNNNELAMIPSEQHHNLIDRVAKKYNVDFNALVRWSEKYPEKGLDELAGSIKYHKDKNKK